MFIRYSGSGFKVEKEERDEVDVLQSWNSKNKMQKL